jgi:hypothetical protein
LPVGATAVTAAAVAALVVLLLVVELVEAELVVVPPSTGTDPVTIGSGPGIVTGGAATGG